MNKSINKKVSLLVLIVLALSMMFTGLATAKVFAQSDTETNVVYSNPTEFEYDDNNVFYYEVWFSPVEEFTSFSLALEFPEFINVMAVTPNYQLGADADGRVGITTGSNAGTYTYETEDNLLTVSLVSTQVTSGDVRLFSLELMPTENVAQTGEVYVDSYQFINSNEQELAVDFDLGDITISEKSQGVMGDMDGDGDVDLIDLVTVQRSVTDLSGQYALNELQAVLADINDDGIIDIIDCQLIRKYIVGLIDSLENYGKPVIEEYTVTVWYYDENGNSTNAGDFTVPAKAYLVETLTEIAKSYGSEVEAFYFDGDLNEQISIDYVIASDLEVWVVLAVEEQTAYVMNVYGSSQNGFVFVGQYTVEQGANIRKIISENYPDMMEIVDGIFYDEEMKRSVSEEAVVNSNLDVYLYAEEMHGGSNEEGDEQEIYLSLYGNTVDGGWEYIVQLAVEEGSCIYQTVTGFLGSESDYIEGIYYDSAMSSPVGMNDTATQSVEIYLYSSRVGEDVGGDEVNKNNFIYVEIASEDGQIFENYPIQIAEGEYILQAIRNCIGRDSVNAYYVDEDNTPVTEEDVFSSETFTSIRIVVYTVFINIMDTDCNLLNRVTAYGFEGDYVKRVAVEFADRYGYKIYEVSTSPTFDSSIGDEVVSDLAEIYVMVEGSSSSNEYYIIVSIMEYVNGTYVPSTGSGRTMSEGTDVIQHASGVVEQMLGTLYTIEGYYSDEEMTKEIAIGTTLQEEMEVYVKVKLADVTGEYTVMSMEGDSLGKMTVNADSTATFGELKGNWLVMSGMFFFNYGKYSQGIFSLQLADEGSEQGNVAMLMSDFNAEDFEETEEYKAIAGEYTWYEEEMMEEMGVGAYTFTLHANGVAELTVMGMTMRIPYYVVAENVIQAVMMGSPQCFNVDVENKTLEMNYLANYAGEFDLFRYGENGKEQLGSINIGYDGSAIITYTDGTKVNGTAVYNSGNVAFFISEFHYLHLSYDGSYNNITGFIVYDEFDGSDFVEDPALKEYVGTYDYLRYEDDEELSTITFYDNGAYKVVSYYDYFQMGRYEVVDGVIVLYVYNKYEDTRIVYNQEIGAYVRYYGEVVTPETDENISGVVKYDIVEGWYEVVDGEGIQMYLKQDGNVLIQGDQIKHETTFIYDGNMITIEDQAFLIDFDAMTVQPIVNTDYNGEITLQ